MKLLCSLLVRCAWLPLLLLTTSCDRPEAPIPPPHLLSKPELTSVLIQLHLLEARIESSRLQADSARAMFQSQQHEIFWQHNISEDDSSFQRSYRYYAVHDKDLEDIYQAVIDSLAERDRQLGGTPDNRTHF